MMASRLFWIGIAGLALLTGMVLQDGTRMWSWASDSGISARAERSIEARVDAAIDRSIDRMEVVDSDGRAVPAGADARRAFADAVGELVKAESDLAMVKIRDGAADEMATAIARRDAARAEVDRLKTAMKADDRAAAAPGAEDSRKIEQSIRDEVREAVRDAVRN
jgi:hypothetical protein